MAPCRWLFYPDFRSANPYQDLLARALSAGADPGPGTITDALEAVAQRPTVFHLHWEHTLYGNVSSEAEAIGAIRDFSAELTVFRDCGGRLVWTMHNAEPHEDRFPAVSAKLRHLLAEQADVVHVHGQVGAELARGIGASADQILIVPHPDLAPAYPDDIDDAAARRYFSFGPYETVFAFLGPMRNYKGIPMLVQAFDHAHRENPAAQLLLAGAQPRNQDGRFFLIKPGVRVVPHFIDDGIVQYVLRAADYVVLPYQRILSSGAVALALGFGRPVIVPGLPALLEVVQHEQNSLVYEPGDPEALAQTMLEACRQPADIRHLMRNKARATAQSVTFAQLAHALTERLGLIGAAADGISA